MSDTYVIEDALQDVSDLVADEWTHEEIQTASLLLIAVVLTTPRIQHKPVTAGSGGKHGAN